MCLICIESHLTYTRYNKILYTIDVLYPFSERTSVAAHMHVFNFSSVFYY